MKYLRILSHLALVYGTVLFMAACTSGTHFNDVARMQAPETMFQKTLFTEYLELSRTEAAEADYDDSDVFAARAKAVAEGKQVLPENLATRVIPQEAVIPLTDAREALLKAIRHPAVMSQAAEDLALAQTQYDCWIQEQEENFQHEDIDVCRNGYMSAMKVVQAIMDAPFGKQEWVLYFNHKRFDLRDDAATVLAEIIDLSKRHPDTHFIINAHADRSGDDLYNFKLSRNRASTVMRALRDSGIEISRLKIVDSWGESKPAVATKDGVAEPLNRRVTVLLSDENGNTY